MPKPNPLYHTDQAKHLRDLAGRNEPLQSPDARPQSAGPRGIMIGELQGLNRGYALAWHLASDACRRGLRTMIVDLSPAASRLPEIVQGACSLRGQTQAARMLPLWQETAHGRSLSTWYPSTAQTIDVLAQTEPAYPSAEQMARFCEQLIRHITQPQCSTYDIVYFLSNASGIPHDGPCWQSANELLIIWDASEVNELQLAAAVRARRSLYAENQRLLILSTKNPSLVDWKIGRTKLRQPHAEARDKPTLSALLGENAETLLVTLPKLELTKASANRYLRTAKELTKVLDRLPIGSLTRQAS
jgi:hypothetical protein